MLVPIIHLQHLSHVVALAGVSDSTLGGNGHGGEESEGGCEHVELSACMYEFSQIWEC